jgi:hypothetical protein
MLFLVAPPKCPPDAPARPGGVRVFEDRGRGGRVLPPAPTTFRAARRAAAAAALATSSDLSTDESGSGEENSDDEDDTSDDSDAWAGELLALDDAAMADFAANCGESGDGPAAAAATHARIAAMALGGEGARRAPRHARSALDGASESSSDSEDDTDDSDDDSDDSGDDSGDDSEDDDVAAVLGGSAPAAGWAWGTGGRAVRRGAPGAAAKRGAAPGAKPRKGARPVPGEKARVRKEAIKAKRVRSCLHFLIELPYQLTTNTY